MNDAGEAQLHLLDYWRILRLRASLVTLVLLVVMTTFGVTISFLPREYFSKVTMEVKPDKSGSIDVFGTAGRVFNDPTFVSTQFQILQRTEILYPVIESLGLVEAWKVDGRQMPLLDVYDKLVRKMDLREVRNTGLIEVGVYSTDPKEAALIANRIAVVYRDKRLADMKQNVDRGLGQLREEVEKQRKRVEEAAARMAEIRLRDAINDPDPESLNSTLSASDRNLVAMEQQLNEQRLVVTKLGGQLEQIAKMKPEELKEVLRTLNIEDQTVVKMVSSLQDAIADEAKLRANGLGENHPRIRALSSQREVYARQLSESLETVRQSQKHKLEIETRTFDALKDKFTEAKAGQIQDKQKMGAYSDSKSQYLQSKKIFEAAQIKYSTELLERGIDFEPAKIWENAEAALRPSRPRILAYMSLALLLGLGMGVGLAFFIEYLDTSVKTVDDVEGYLQAPVLASIPRHFSSVPGAHPHSAEAEAFRILRTNLELRKPAPHANTCTLVSGGPGEGKSTTLHHLARVSAAGGSRVLVVDADLRRPRQHELFEQEKAPGLSDCLLGRASVDSVVRSTGQENLSFIASGELPDEALGILSSQRMVELVRALKGRYDLILFDSPPILGVSDGAVLAAQCEMAVMVVQYRRFPRSMLQRVRQAVLQAGGRLVGVVLNQVDGRHDDVYGYAEYHGYGATAKERAKDGRKPVSPVASASSSEDY